MYGRINGIAEAVIRITGYKISGFPQQINARNSQGKDYWNPYFCASEVCKVFAGTPESEDFLQQLPHQFYEENNLHMMLITGIKDYPKCMEEVLRFLPYIDNWATCDFPEPKCFRKNKKAVLEEVGKSGSNPLKPTPFVMESVCLCAFFLDEDFSPEYLEMTAGVQSQEYYVNMMIAWYFATALAKQWDAAVPYIEQHRLSDWVHKKTIQKAVESYRITSEQKEYLKGYR